MSTQAVPKRSDVPVHTTWDTGSVFASDEAWAAELVVIGALLPDLARFQDHLDTPTALVECLEAVERITRTLKFHVYAGMFYNTDTGYLSAVSRNDRASGLFARLFAAISFVDPALVAIGFDTLRRWIAEEPRLRIYAHYFDSLELQQAHVRSAEVEEVLGMVSDPFRTAGETHTILADADMRFEPARDVEDNEVEYDTGNGRSAPRITGPGVTSDRLCALRRRASGAEEHHGQLSGHGRQAERLSRRGYGATPPRWRRQCRPISFRWRSSMR